MKLLLFAVVAVVVGDLLVVLMRTLLWSGSELGPQQRRRLLVGWLSVVDLSIAATVVIILIKGP